MSSFVVEPNLRAQGAEVAEDELRVSLADGRRVSVPLAWFPRLLHASSAQRAQWEPLGDGEGIHWPDLDEDLSVAPLTRRPLGVTETVARLGGRCVRSPEMSLAGSSY
jgi:hypothetical protein